MCRPAPLALQSLCPHTTQRDCQTTLEAQNAPPSIPFEWDASLTLPDWLALVLALAGGKIWRWIKYPGGLSSSYVN